MRRLVRFFREHPDAGAVVALAALVTCAFWKLVLTRQFTFLETPDIPNVILPWLQVQARALRSGHIALWDPFMIAGQPLLGQLQPGVANPLTYLLLALPLENGQLRPECIHYWFVLLHLLAALFAYAFFRDLQCRPAAAVLGGLFYAIGGYVGNVTTPPYLTGVIWTPLAFLLLFRSLRGTRPVGNAALAGLVLGLVWLSGHHQTACFLTLAVAGILLFAVIQAGKARRSMATRAAVLLVVMGLVSAVQMLPAIEYGHHAVRWVELPDPVGWNDKTPYLAHQNNSLPASQLPFLALPGGGTTLWNPMVGLVGISLVALALAADFQSRHTRVLAASALGALLFAIARFDPLHGVLYTLLPGLDKARSPAVALSVMHFAVSPLVALGAHRLLSGGLPVPWLNRAAKYVGWAAAGILVLVLLDVPMMRRIDRGAERFAMTALTGLLLAAVYTRFGRRRLSAGLGAASLAFLLLIEHGSNTGFDYPDIAELKRKDGVLPRLTGGTRDLADFVRRLPGPRRVEIDYRDFLFNFGDWYGVEVMAGFVPSVPESIYKLTWWEPRILSMYGVNYSIGAKPSRPGQREIYAGPRGLRVYANDNAMPRAWTVHRLQAAGKDAARLVRDSGFDFRERAVVAGAAPQLETCGGADAVHLDYENIQRLRLQVEMQCRGMVIVGDNAFPGWQAAIDGRPTPIYAANTALRGVVADRGRHEIVMEYRPATAAWGLALTLAGAAIALILALRKEPDGAGVLDDQSGRAAAG